MSSPRPISSITPAAKSDTTVDLTILILKVSEGFSSASTLVSLWAACHVWMLYGLLTGNLFLVFFTYILGDVFAVLFIIIYYRVTNEKRYVAKVAGGLGVFL